MTAILGSLDTGIMDEAALHPLLGHHGNRIDTARIAGAVLTVIGRRPGHLFADNDLLVGFAGHPFLAGRPIEDAAGLACAFRAGLLDDTAELNGHFAIAIIECRQDRAIFLRDTIGVHPLYWARLKTGIAFASEYKVLRPLPGFDLTPDVAAIRTFEQTGWVPAGTTFFSSVRPVHPGRVTRIGRIGSGYSVTQSKAAVAPTPVSHVSAKTLLDHIDAAVSRFSVGEAGRPGVMLSSGVDSALVAALVARARAAGPLDAFTVGHKGRDPEIEGAAETARALGLNHHVLELEPRDLSHWLPECIWTMENPGGHDEYPCLFALCHLASDHVGTLYSGNLSDTLFAGMQSHMDLWRRINGLDADMTKKPAPLSILAGTVPGGTGADGPPPFRSLRDELAATMNRRDERMAAQAMFAARFGVDLRMPFADRTLIDLAFRIPDDQKVGPEGGKRILREAAALLLPQAIAARPKRIQSLAHDAAMQSWLLDMLDHLMP
jgi:asparagine synthase (glutamine-hydrolysing)